MTDWGPLHAAILANDSNARRLAQLRTVDAWTALPWDAAQAACDQASPTLERAREVNAHLALVMTAWRRDLGVVDGADGLSRLQALERDYLAGALQAGERRLWERASVAFGLWWRQRQRDPAVAEAAAPSAQETAARAELDALIERQQALQPFAVAGQATAERMAALQAVFDDYAAPIAAAAPGSPLHVDLCFWAAHAASSAARGWGVLGRIERAARLLAQAAVLFEQGDRPGDAAACADNARRLGHAVDGDLAAASREDLRALVGRDIDPFARARAQGRLSALARAANDVFDACDWADKALASLAAAGFADPQSTEGDALAESWIRRACRDAGALPLLLQVGDLCQSLLGARHARWAGADAARARAIEAALERLQGLLLEITAQPGIARHAVNAGLARYLPGWQPRQAEPESLDAMVGRLKEIGARIEAIKHEANAADAVRDPPALQALLARVAACVADARATGLAPTVGLACHTEAYVRLRAGDPAGAQASALAGEAALLDGQSLAPHELAGHPQFDLLLELRAARVQALLMQVDNDGLRTLAQECVRLVEARRWQVADPYQRAAFLASRTLFYEMAVLACWRLKRWDELLAAMELVKARAAVLDRLAPPRSDADAALVAQLDAVAARIATTEAGSDAHTAAREQRRLLLGLLAIERGRGAAVDPLPAPDVATLQSGLAPDEAIVAWVWVATGVVLVLAITPDGFDAERVKLSDDECALLDDHVALVRGDGATVRAFDAMVTRLANVFLPAATRAFIAKARRLILSPHRALHLLPFHAAVFDGRFLVEQAAVRYVPNLSGLLLPAREQAASPTRAPLVAVGIDEFAVPGQQWSALAAAQHEARAVADAWARHDVEADVLLGPQASVAAVAQRLADGRGVRCVHLATHASSVFADGAADDPFGARLILQDGFVDALALAQWRLDADVVVLSACDSGQRALDRPGLAELPGDDLFGLQASLFEAGAQAVVGAAWPVDDRVAPGLMARLHDGLAAGVPADLALQAAMLHHLAQPDSRRRIYFWAPLFVTSLGRLAAPANKDIQRA